MLSNAPKKYLMHGGSWALGGKIFISIANALFLAILTRVLTVEEMSAFFLGQSIATFLAISGRFGIENTLLRRTSEYLALDRNEKAVSGIVKGLVLVGVFSAILAFGYYFLVGGWVSEYMFHSPILSTITGFVAGWSIILSFQLVYGAIFRAFQLIKYSIFYSGGFFSAGVLLLLFLTARREVGIDIYGALWIVIVVGVAVLLLAFGAMGKQISKIKIQPSGDTARYTDLLSHSWPLWINSLTQFVLSQSGIWIVGLYYTGIEVAVYGAASRLLLLAGMSLAIMNVVLPPLIAKYNVLKKKRELEILLRSTASIAAAPALIIFMFFLVIPGQLLNVVFGGDYKVGASILSVLTIGQIVSVLSGSCGYVLIISGNKNLLMLISFFSAVIAVSFGITSVSKFGAVGVATSFSAAILIQQVLMLIAVKVKVGVWTHAGINETRMFLKRADGGQGIL